VQVVRIVDMSDNIVLQTLLPIAVSSWRIKVQKNREYYNDDFLIEQLPKLATIIASHGDEILYKTKNTHQRFNELASAIAFALELTKQNITLFGVEFNY
jgi:hypothetical protein